MSWVSVSGLRPDVGSSVSRTEGWPSSSTATLNRLSCPPDNWCAGLSKCSLSPRLEASPARTINPCAVSAHPGSRSVQCNALEPESVVVAEVQTVTDEEMVPLEKSTVRQQARTSIVHDGETVGCLLHGGVHQKKSGVV